MPGNEDANLMAAVISFFVLLGTIRYWMSLSSKAENKKAENKKSLLKAAEDCDMHKVASLIKAGTDVVCKNGAGNTAVELAQNAQTIDLLKGAGVTMPEFPEEEKIDLLIEYAKKGLAGGALMAIQAGEDVNHKDKAGNTAVELAQNAQTIDLLKGEGTTMPEFPEEKKNNLLIEYAKKGATGGALMAIQAGEDVNHKDREGNSCLHITAAQGGNVILRILLNAGTKVSAKNKAGYTSIELVVEQKHEAHQEKTCA
jgi:ankyrin repeat protein